MKILADQYLYRISDFIPEDLLVEYYRPEEGFPEYAAEFDALLIRTVTKINPDTVPTAGNLKFTGSATAGFDHVDTPHLEKLGIEFARAAGCNANAVAEYVITALFRWADVTGTPLSDKKIGIAGMGHTGGSVARYLEKLNIRFAGYDPAKQERETDFTSCSVDELLDCDILTFHVPLISSGIFKTRHMCSSEWVEKGFDLIINAARGGIVDEKALLQAKRNGLIGDYILDVWENEPLFTDEIADEAFIATPHIAGYSKQAKWVASKMVVDQMCDFFGIEKRESSFLSGHTYRSGQLQQRGYPNSPGNPDSPRSAGNPNSATPTNSSRPQPMYRTEVPPNHTNQPQSARSGEWSSFARFLWEYHKIHFYESEFRKIIGKEPIIKNREFSLLRSESDTRFEFASIINALGISEGLDPNDPRQIFLD